MSLYHNKMCDVLFRLCLERGVGDHEAGPSCERLRERWKKRGISLGEKNFHHSILEYLKAEASFFYFFHGLDLSSQQSQIFINNSIILYIGFVKRNQGSIRCR